MREYFIKRGTNAMGPLSGEKIGGLIKGKKLKPADQISETADGPWEKLSEVYKDVLAGTYASAETDVGDFEPDHPDDSLWDNYVEDGYDYGMPSSKRKRKSKSDESKPTPSYGRIAIFAAPVSVLMLGVTSFLLWAANQLNSTPPQEPVTNGQPAVEEQPRNLTFNESSPEETIGWWASLPETVEFAESIEGHNPIKMKKSADLLAAEIRKTFGKKVSWNIPVSEIGVSESTFRCGVEVKGKRHKLAFSVNASVCKSKYSNPRDDFVLAAYDDVLGSLSPGDMLNVTGEIKHFSIFSDSRFNEYQRLGFIPGSEFYDVLESAEKSVTVILQLQIAVSGIEKVGN